MHRLNIITFTFIYPKICCMSNGDIQEPCQCDVLYEEHVHTNRSSLTESVLSTFKSAYLWIANTKDTCNSEQNLLNAAVYITYWTLKGSLMFKDSS